VTVPARTGSDLTGSDAAGSDLTGSVPAGPVQPTFQRLIPLRFRPAAVAILVACVITVGVLGALFYHGSTPDALDRAVFRLVWPHRAGLDPLAAVGDTVPMALLTVVLCYCCLALRRYRGAIMVAVAVPVAAGATELLKHVIHRIYINFLSFPSGHTTATFALITCVAVLLINPPATKAPASMRIALAAVSVGIGGAVALGLVAARFHYFTDTIAGAAVGIGVVLAFALVLDSAAGTVAASSVAARLGRTDAAEVPAEAAGGPAAGDG
jgi:membrane-associated phospholipid phosphatase